jgi:hypothetical protein
LGQRLAIAEAVEDRALGHAGFAGDVAHGHGGHAVGVEALGVTAVLGVAAVLAGVPRRPVGAARLGGAATLPAGVALIQAGYPMRPFTTRPPARRPRRC